MKLKVMPESTYLVARLFIAIDINKLAVCIHEMLNKKIYENKHKSEIKESTSTELSS